MGATKENTSEKKHINQMTEEEKDFLLSYIKNIPADAWSYNFYTENRIKERGGTKEFILESIQIGELIEYHLRNGRNRILLRGKKAVSDVHPYVPCVVLELKTKKIITVYWNHIDDNHRTIKMENYNEELNVIKSFHDND